MNELQTISPELVAAIAAAIGAVVVKIFEKWMSNRNNQKSIETLQNYHKQELDSLREELDKANKNISKWQKKYWEATSMTDSDEHKIDELTKKVQDLQSRLDLLSEDKDDQ